MSVAKSISVILVCCAAMVLLMLSGLLYQYFATKIDNYRYPAPGKLIDVGGYKLHIYGVGSGNPTVILDAGLSANLSWWELVQKDVSTFTKVCSFDRAGYGWSDAGKEPRTSEMIVQELHSLLHATADTPPPYILVGHSFGGANMRLYANRFPDEVFGLILVDACHEKQYQNSEKEDQSSYQNSWSERCKEYILNSTFAHYIGLTRWFMASAMKPYFSDLMSQALQKVIIAKASTVKSLKARDSELASIYESLTQVQKSENTLTEKPLIVITAGRHGNENIDSLWMECQQELVKLSHKGKHIIAEKSGHMINVDQPEIIIEAIHKLVEQYNEHMQFRNG